MRRIATFVGLALISAPAIGSEAGQGLFETNCSGCHQLGGIGSPGLAPPLADDALWQGLGDKAPKYFSGIMMSGLSGKIVAKGETYIGLAMPSQAALSDEDLAAIADYVLHDLNGITSLPTVESFAAARGAPPTHPHLKAMRKEALP
jgi:mono/diheme cytochrome c family protein